MVVYRGLYIHDKRNAKSRLSNTSREGFYTLDFGTTAKDVNSEIVIASHPNYRAVHL